MHILGKDLAILADFNEEFPPKGPMTWLLAMANFAVQVVSPSALSDTSMVLASSVKLKENTTKVSVTIANYDRISYF